jgi:hypothetical protein
MNRAGGSLTRYARESRAFGSWSARSPSPPGARPRSDPQCPAPVRAPARSAGSAARHRPGPRPAPTTPARTPRLELTRDRHDVAVAHATDLDDLHVPQCVRGYLMPPGRRKRPPPPLGRALVARSIAGFADLRGGPWARSLTHRPPSRRPGPGPPPGEYGVCCIACREPCLRVRTGIVADAHAWLRLSDTGHAPTLHSRWLDCCFRGQSASRRRFESERSSVLGCSSSEGTLGRGRPDSESPVDTGFSTCEVSCCRRGEGSR